MLYLQAKSKTLIKILPELNTQRGRNYIALQTQSSNLSGPSDGVRVVTVRPLLLVIEVDRAFRFGGSFGGRFIDGRHSLHRLSLRFPGGLGNCAGGVFFELAQFATHGVSFWRGRHRNRGMVSLWRNMAPGCLGVIQILAKAQAGQNEYWQYGTQMHNL